MGISNPYHYEIRRKFSNNKNDIIRLENNIDINNDNNIRKCKTNNKTHINIKKTNTNKSKNVSDQKNEIKSLITKITSAQSNKKLNKSEYYKDKNNSQNGNEKNYNIIKKKKRVESPSSKKNTFDK